VGVLGQHEQRRLAAILAADVVGYSRLMSTDEGATLASLKVHLGDLIDPKITDYGGRVVKLMGDGLLAEFPSVVHAVRCATDIQQEMVKHNDNVPDDRQLRFRIGINVGDIIIDGEDIYGDGVNIAARLEALANPGGVCIPSVVHDQIAGKLDVSFTDGGAHRVKNLAQPLHVWRWAPHGLELDQFLAPSGTPPLPDKPSIAVLPFENMSGDSEQEYFSDGVTEDIITELSRYPDFLVIARNSTFQYKNKDVDFRQIARNLGVQYVLEGSVRKAGNMLRLNAQLIDASTGTHLWAERYDRRLDDIFAVQDELTEIIVGTLGETLHEERIKSSMRKDPSSHDAYDKALQAWAHFNRFNKSSNTAARRLCEAAIELDPAYARAYAILAQTYLMEFSSYWTDDPDETLRKGYDIARKAVTLDDQNTYAYLGLGSCETWLGRHQQAIAHVRRAIKLNRNDADIHAWFANMLVFSGLIDEALEELATAMRLNPHYPEWYLQFLGRAYLVQRRYEDAEAAFERVVTINPGWPWARLVLAASHAALGKTAAARAEVADALRTSPDLTLAFVPKAWPFKDPAELEHVIDLLRKAGLPE
jgi:adenylate cyclase